MTIVLDASAAIEIALNRKYSKKFKEYLNDADIVIAPETFYSEITNTFWKYANAQELDTRECENGILGCIDLVDDYITTRDMCKEVFSESTKIRHPAYDIFYLVIARRQNAGILTVDKKMKKIAKELGVLVLGEDA